MKLPLILSVPHAGVHVPPEVEAYRALPQSEIVRDGDEEAAGVYSFAARVEHWVSTDVARAIVDLNRAEDDRRPDGVVKTHTCWNVPVYRTFPPQEVIRLLLDRYWRPYHRKLSSLAGSEARLGIDCHTMAAVAPPVAPDAGAKRPWVCLSDGEGACPWPWIEELAESFRQVFPEGPVRINEPFRGGFITRFHGHEMPWMQLEIARGPFLSVGEKRRRVIQALAAWSAGHR